jgi:hypothetical protein
MVRAMLYNCFLKSGIVYVPTVVKMKTGVYSDVEPVAVVPVANTEGLRRSFLDAIERRNVVVPNPPKDDWPPPVLLKYSGAKTWSAFARGTSQWSIIQDEQSIYQIVGYRNHPDGYWAQDPDQKISFSRGATVYEVIDRMISILQDAMRR